jgi:hypothetical protein
MTEAHMLKPFDERVGATLDFFESMDSFLEKRGEVLIELKKVADKNTIKKDGFYTKWQVTKEADSLMFPGFESTESTSALSGSAFVEYDKSRPYRRIIPYYNKVKGYYFAKLPEYYIIPQAWKEVVERLKANDVHMTLIPNDTLIEVTSKYIGYYETSNRPYEGHYPHKNIGTADRKEKLLFHEGDYLIPTNQVSRRYLAVVLDPQSEDSFFSWNFFDSILNQKEYYSSYLFEKTAAQLIEKDVMLRRSFEAKKRNEPDFASDAAAQLQYIYENSLHYEKGHLRVPVFEIR